MAERMTDEQVRGLLDLCLSYPSGSDYSMAPVRIGEVVSVLDEVLELRGEVAHLRGLATAPMDGRELDADPEWDDDEDDDEPYDEWDDGHYGPDDPGEVTCHGCGVCDDCTERTAYEMADLYRDEVERLNAEIARLTRIVEERDAPPAEVARVLAALGKVDR